MKTLILAALAVSLFPISAAAFTYSMPTRSGGNSNFGYTANLSLSDSWSSSSKTYRINGNASCNGLILGRSVTVSNGSGYFQASGNSKTVRRVYSLQVFGATVASGDTTYNGVTISASSTPFVKSNSRLVSAPYTIGIIPCTLTAGASASIKYNASATWIPNPSAGTPNFAASLGPAADIAALGGTVVGNQRLVSAGFEARLTLIKSELSGWTKAYWSASNASVLPQASYGVNWINTTLNGSIKAKVTTLKYELFTLNLGSWSGFAKTTPLTSGSWRF
jgi:hypothetical protein